MNMALFYSYYSRFNRQIPDDGNLQPPEIVSQYPAVTVPVPPAHA